MLRFAYDPTDTEASDRLAVLGDFRGQVTRSFGGWE